MAMSAKPCDEGVTTVTLVVIKAIP
jgi:hypothetical protein